MSIHGSLRSIFRICGRACYKMLPLEWFLRLKFRVLMGRSLNLDNPSTFSEKIYCLKVLNGELRAPLIQRCYDKVNVRDYVVEKLGQKRGEAILNELYGVYDRPEVIDFNQLPNAFALKVTQSSGFNVLCLDKNRLDKSEVVQKLKDWQRISNMMGDFSEEGYIYDGHARICCERYLRQEDGSVPPDIRIYCFHGVPRLFVCDFGTTNDDGSHGTHIVRNVYDESWNLLEVDLGRPHDPSVVMEKPDNLDELIFVARKLSEDFPFVRVDLYNLNESIIFGELTWIPMGGNCIISPLSFDREMGSWLDIPNWHDPIETKRQVQEPTR